VLQTYNTLLDAGWQMNHIDTMDFIGFMKVRAWKAKREQIKRAPKKRYIDEVWPGLHP
jgi:hypothetical protein